MCDEREVRRGVRQGPGLKFLEEGEDGGVFMQRGKRPKLVMHYHRVIEATSRCRTQLT